MQGFPVYRSRPHQTGVTERSISDDDRHAADHIIENVMVSHLADGIGARIPAKADGHNHFLGVKLALGLRDELRARDGMKHPFEIIEARHNRGESNDEHRQGKENFTPEAYGSPQNQSEEEACESRDQSVERSALMQRHGQPKCSRRLVTEGTDDEGWDKEKSDGDERAGGERSPEPA